MKPNTKPAFIALLIGLLVLAAFYIYSTITPRLFGAQIDPPKPMPAFSLPGLNGPVSLADQRGKLVVLFFGYTSCPDVCPLTMANLREAFNLLSTTQASQVQVIFISVDWKRDTAASVAKYAAIFHPSFLGLTGTQAQIDQISQDYGVFYKLNAPGENGFYSVEHTATSMILDREGRLVALWNYGTSGSQMAADLKVLLQR
jgi:protein SCO1/2